MYREIIDLVSAVTDGEQDLIANLANTASVLYHMLPDVNWAGFYLLKDNELVLGPFHGKPACIRIAIGRGVCGTSARDMRTVVVDNVHEYPGHIACDAQSASEIVVPMLDGGKLVGVLDVDSPLVSRFADIDRQYLEQLVQLLMSRCRP
jgi:GAF domain-containing protein